MQWSYIFVFLVLGFAPAGAQTLSITYRAGKIGVWPVQGDAVLKVCRGALSLAQSLDKTAILGRRSTSGDTLFFLPLVPFPLGETYTVVFADSSVHHFRVPLPEDYVRARVEQVYPSADTLPANLLKFHLLFSRPMQVGNVYSHIALLTAAGDTVDRALLPLNPPLWNADGTVLTLWLEPGRIKRELNPFQKLGPILQTGEYYALTIDTTMKDANGLALAAPCRQTFYVAERDTARPDATTWQLSRPDAASRAPLSIRFGETLDWATATTYLQVQNASGEAIAGAWHLSDQERQAGFIPAQPWKAGRYQIRINPKLEDVAGNNIHRLFDREISAKEMPEGVTVLELIIN